MSALPDNVTPLSAAAARKRSETRRKVEAAIAEFDRTGAEVSVAAVAKAAGVSRSWIYDTADVREAIILRRADQRAVGVPANQAPSVASLRSRLQTALDDNKRLRSEVKELRDAVARAHGARLDRATGGASDVA